MTQPLQSALQQRIREALQCANDFNGDLHALADYYGIPASPISGRMIAIANKTDTTVSSASAALNYLEQNYQSVVPTLALNFLGEALDSRITFTRASSATYFNSAGVLTTAGNNVPRLDYNPATLAARGLLIEEQRTNSIRNNTMQGAVAPSTFPTNWQSVIVAGLTATVVGTGTQNGITYLDVRVNGTPSFSSYYNLVPDILVAGASGQTWTGSFWASLIAGSLSNTNANIEIRESNAAQGFLTNTLTALPITSVLTRYSQARTLTNASTAFVSVRFVFQVTSGLPVDFTLRIGLPQLEQGAFATSVIPTTTTALTRSADVASVNTLSPWYNSAVGTLFADATSTGYVLDSGFPLVVSIDDGSNTNRITIQQSASSTSLTLNVRTANVSTTIGDSGFDLSSTPRRIAGAYSGTSVTISVNGNSAITGTSNGVPSGLTNMKLGSAIAGYLSGLNGHLRRVTYYPRALSAAELQSITA